MSRRKVSKVKGLYTALLTPFDSRGKVDLQALDRLVQFQVSKGVEGLYPCGSTGLGPMLSLDERKLVAGAVVENAAGRVPVVVQVGAADTMSTIELAKHAERVGAYAVASLTPYYYKPGDEAILKHFEAVSKSIHIPLLAYNIPQFTGNPLDPASVVKMFEEGTISGIKDSYRDFLHLVGLLDRAPEDLVVMNGTEEYALFAIMSGADGLVSGGANAFPELFKSLVASHRQGRVDAALQAQEKVRRVKDLVSSGPVSWYYEVLRERGVPCGVPRPPFLEREAKEVKKVVAGLEELGVLGSN